MTALVLFAEGSLLSCVRYVIMHISILYNIQRYVSAVNSGLKCTRKLLPPNFPTIQLIFHYDTFETKIHPDCPGGRSLHGTIHRDFDIPSDVISALSDINKKIHSGTAHVTGVSSSPTPAAYIETPS